MSIDGPTTPLLLYGGSALKWTFLTIYTYLDYTFREDSFNDSILK